MYLVSVYSVSFKNKSDTEIEQASYRVGEYFGIISEFAIDMKSVGEQYFEVKILNIDDKMEDLQLYGNGTYKTDKNFIDLNRVLIGKGDADTIKQNEKYINVAYIFDSFFRDFTEGFEDVISISYYSRHDFIYTYSEEHEYLYDIEFYSQKFKYEEIIKQIESPDDIIWSEQKHPVDQNERIIEVSVPLYVGEEIEGVISIQYSLKSVNDILKTNFYPTYLFDKDGVIVSTNVSAIAENEYIVTLKDSTNFNEKTEQKIVNTAFYPERVGYLPLNSKYYLFMPTICEDFAILVYVPKISYFFNVFVTLFAIIFVGKVAFWLNDVYEKRSFMALELRDKYNELNSLKLELEKAANTDFLTKLYNRRYMLERIESERVVRYNTNFSVLMIDIDHFKKVNDTYGHKAGDEVLKYVAKIILDSVRKTDLVCRWGGEEMLVVAPNENGGNGFVVADKIRKNVEKSAPKVDGQEINVTISIGVSILKPEDSFEHILSEADEALYSAKETGRNKVVIYSGEKITN